MHNKLISLSEAASIAIHAMVYVAKNGDKTSVVSIAEAFSFSKHHVAKVMQRLSKEKLVSSSRGPNGGFFLAKAAADISLLDIFEAIEGKLEQYECFMGYGHCEFKDCLLGGIMDEMTLQFANFLRNRSLQYYLNHKF
jgi:Rrf2 family protein